MSKEALSGMMHAAFPILVGCVVSGASFWVVFAREVPTTQEVSQMISRESPYMQDRALILDQLRQSNDSNKALAAAVSDLRVAVGKLEEALQK
jgi:hypothetical protein